MRALVLGIMLVLTAASCAPQTSTTATTGAVVLPSETAVQEITNARCSREQACNDVGIGPYFSSQEECIRQRGSDTRTVLSAEKCPNGLTDGKLVTCLNDIHNEGCVHRLDTIVRIDSCRSSKLCR